VSATIPIHDAANAARLRNRQAPKGRRVDPAVLAQLQAWLGETAPRRDLLIEALHTINDRLRCLPTPHLAALAQWMKLSQAEVYEVASFYHHFDIVREGADGRCAPAAALTVRVCSGLPCQMAGGADLLARLQVMLGPHVRVFWPRPVWAVANGPGGRGAPEPVPQATPAAVQAVVQSDVHTDTVRGHHHAARLLAGGGYELLRQCQQGLRDPDAVIQALEGCRPAGPGRRGLSGRPQVAHRARRSRRRG
jgi:NADH:ubiquinone oxidoreductase subunit E